MTTADGHSGAGAAPAADEEQEQPRWVLTPAEFAATKDRAAAINRRAAKRGFTGRIEVTGTEREVSETDEAGLKRTRLVVDTLITGEAPCYNGWVFLAAVDTVETGDGTDFILRTAPGVEESGVDRTDLVAGRCQHCNTVRRNRRYTYLVRSTETGETVQVGSTCIKDFTGWRAQPVFIEELAIQRDLEGFLGGLGGAAVEYGPETVVAAAWGISRRYGWVPASAAGYGTRSTRELVESYLYGKTKADGELRTEVASEIPAAAEMAKAIIPALLEGLEGGSDYTANLKACLRAPAVDHRHMGIVVSAVAAYEKMTGAQLERKARQERLTEYAGTVGDKATFTGTVSRLVPVENNYGYRTTSSMLVIVEAGTAVYKMFTAAVWAWEIEQGHEVTITGTVKAHEEYHGDRQTVIVRPRKAIETTSAPSTAEHVRKARGWADVNLTRSYPGTPALHTLEELAAMPDEEILSLVERHRP